jgi:branched-chain amino acid transport system permease protein
MSEATELELAVPELPAREGEALGQLGLALIAAAAVAVFLPVLVSSYWLRTFTSSAILGLASLSVSLLYAQLGLVSLAQNALLGVGGWVALRLAHGNGLPFEFSLLGGGVVAAAFGLVFGLPALRMRGLYLAVITLMMAGAVQVVLLAWGFPNGGPGFRGRVIIGGQIPIQRPDLATGDAAYFRYCVVIITICFLLVYWLRASRPGRAWAMIRRGEACALAGGVNIVAFKVYAFTLAGLLAGIAGGLQAGSVGQLDGRGFPASDSIILFALTVVAGAYNWIGPIIAGLMFRAVPALLNDWRVDGNIATVIFGVGLLHALITAPNGISGQFIQLIQAIILRAARLRRGSS